MNVKRKVLETIKKHDLLQNGTHIVLGLSGGPDSVCLFDVLCELACEKDLTIHPVHVNHKFRPGAAEEDQRYVELLCRQRGLECRSFVTDCGKLAKVEGMTPEEAGRKARYEAFRKTADEIADCTREKIVIAVAQNANDQAETILFRMLRGTGTDGLAGIAYKRYEGDIPVIRPLLDVTRDEIEKYCEARNLSPRMDHTNKETIYARNKIRLELLPYLEENFNSNVIETLNRLGRNAACDKDFLNTEAERALTAALVCADSENETEKKAEAEILVSEIKKFHRAVRMRVYNKVLERIGTRENITEAQLSAVEKVLFSESPSASCDLASGYRAAKIYDKLRFYETARVQGEDRYRMTFLSPEAFAERSAAGIGIQNGVFGLTQSEAERVCIRTRRDGDRIAIRHKDGVKSKKLQDFFTDVKLPKIDRDEIRLLACGKRILWILPSERFGSVQLREKGRFSAEFQVSGEAETVLLLEIL